MHGSGVHTQHSHPINAGPSGGIWQIPPGIVKSFQGPQTLPGRICPSREEFGWNRIFLARQIQISPSGMNWVLNAWSSVTVRMLQPIIAGDRIRIWVGLKMLVPAKSSLEREILPGRILSPRKDWKDSGRNLQIPPVASGNYRL